MKATANAYISVGIMAAMAVVIGASLGMKHLGSKVVPLLVSSIVFILAAVDLGKQLSAKNGAGARAKKGEDHKTKAEEWRGYLPIGSWILGFFLAYSLLGYVVAIFVLLLSYTKSYGSRWTSATIMAILYSAVTYAIFDIGLSVDLYKGLVLGWLGY